MDKRGIIIWSFNTHTELQHSPIDTGLSLRRVCKLIKVDAVILAIEGSRRNGLAIHPDTGLLIF
jgi:hypothetical protein